MKFDTSAGPFVVEVTRAWAPNAADRFYNLVKNGFYDEARFFRVVPNFMVQFGINGDPAVQTKFKNSIKDDPVKESNKKRLRDVRADLGAELALDADLHQLQGQRFLDTQRFAPFGRVISGMEVVEKINSRVRREAQPGQRSSRRAMRT